MYRTIQKYIFIYSNKKIRREAFWVDTFFALPLKTEIRTDFKNFKLNKIQ